MNSNENHAAPQVPEESSTLPQNALENEPLYIYMRGAGGILTGVHPIRRIPALVSLMIECTEMAALERDEPASLSFYEIEH